MKNLTFKTLIIGILLFIPLLAYAVNDVTLNGNTSFELDTSDTSLTKTITGLSGGIVTQLDIETAYMDVTLDNASDITFSNDASFYFNATVQSGTGSTITPSCPTSLVRLESTGNTVVRLTLTTAEPSCVGGTPTYVCGNAVCESGETVASCPADCGTGGGGGGGGGGYAASTTPPEYSNTRTSTLSSSITKSVSSEKTYTRPLKLSSDIIDIDVVERTKTAQITTETGLITLKPNKESTIFVEIPENTVINTVTEWDGEIAPPLIYPVTKISILGGTIIGSSEKLYRDNVIAVVKVGSTKAILDFSNEVTMEIPVEDVEDYSEVFIYSSPYGYKWTYEGDSMVENGKVIFDTDHFSYFAIERGEGLHESAPISRFVERTFNDIQGHWAEAYIDNIASMGIVSGKSDGVFAPNDYITRAEMTKIAVNAFRFQISEIVDSKPFLDVSTGAWYAPYIQSAKDNGVVQGTDGRFKPDNNISRAEALKILIEAAGFTDIYENYQQNYASNEGWWYVSFPDVLIGEWYARYVAYAKDFGIVGGYNDNTFRPGNPITRAEVAKIVTKVLDMTEAEE